MPTFHQPWPYSAIFCWVKFSHRSEDFLAVNNQYLISCFLLRIRRISIFGRFVDKLSCWTTSQDPLRASDKLLTSCGPYKIKEEVAMVYRRPYLTSGSSGFALNALSRTMKKELKVCILLSCFKYVVLLQLLQELLLMRVC